MTKEEFDYFENLANRLITMKAILGLSQIEKDTLGEAADFIMNYIEEKSNE